MIGVVSAMLTAFYMTRLYVLTFRGEFRGDHHTWSHAHESPRVMTVPLIILAVLSIVGGYVGVPASLGGHEEIAKFLAPSLGHHELGLSHETEWLLMAVSVGAALLGMGTAWIMYARDPRADKGMARSLRSIYPRAQRAYDVDALYDTVVVQPVMRGSEALWQDVDVAMIDGAANGTAAAAVGFGGVLRRWSTGNVQHYMLTVLVGLAIIVFALTMAGGQ
jgi:NADH-quinone oxidoreductase subunit L